MSVHAAKVAFIALVMTVFGAMPLAQANAANEFPKGMVTLTFDDGTKSIFDNINILDAAGFKSTQFIISGAMECADGGAGCTDFMSSANVQSLYANGHEIAAHTRTDPDSGSIGLSFKDLLFQVDALRQDLLTKIGLPVSTFAYPFGLNDTNLIAKLKGAGLIGARTVDLIDINGQIMLNDMASNRYLLNAGQVDVETPVTAAEVPSGWNFGTVESWIDQAATQKKWLILIFHKVDADCTGAGVPLPAEEGGGFDKSCTTPTKLQEIVTYLQGKSATVDVVTMKAGLALMNNNPTSGAALPTIAINEAVLDVVTVEATSTTSIGAVATFTPVVVDSDAVNAPAPLNALCTIAVPEYPVTPSNPFGGHPVWGVNYDTVVSSGSIFPIGTTVVTCTAADVAGNTGTKVFSVVVKPAQAPVIAAHADVFATTTATSGIAVTYTNPTATDNVDATVGVSCTPVSGSIFAIGSTTVTCVAHDTALNYATTTFVVGVSLSTSTEPVPTPTPEPTPTPAPSSGGGSGSGGGGGGIVGGGPLSIGFVNTNPTGSVLGASTGGLSEEQIQAILNLLRSFDADQSVINSVNAALRGSTISGKFTKTLMQGSTGAEVMMLQKMLIDLGFLKVVTPTSFFGSLTKTAVMGYQTSRGIEAVGIVGPKTRAALNSNAAAIVPAGTE